MDICASAINYLLDIALPPWHTFVVATRSACPAQDEGPLYHCTTMTWPLAWERTGKTARWRDEKAGLVVLSLFGVRCAEVESLPTSGILITCLSSSSLFQFFAHFLPIKTFYFCAVRSAFMGLSSALVSVWLHRGASHLAPDKQLPDQ